MIFQSTLPRGERPFLFYATNVIIANFNPRSREGSDWGVDTVIMNKRDFNPRSREGSDRGRRRSGKCSSKFQSTLPRGERHQLAKTIDDANKISIHAPARGATRHRVSAGQLFCISIHAPARGATSILSKIHPMFLTISHNASSFSSFPFHSFLPHLLNSSTFCALFQVRISRAFSVYYRFAPKKSTPDL